VTPQLHPPIPYIHAPPCFYVICGHLLYNVLPMLGRVACALPGSEAGTSDGGPTVQSQQPQEANDGSSGGCCAHSSAGTSKEAAGCCDPPAPPRPPADSALLLLMAAAGSLRACVQLACQAEDATRHTLLPNHSGSNSSGGEAPQPDCSEAHTSQHKSEEIHVIHIQQGLDLMLPLAHSLTVQKPGSCWEEAKDNHPLLLVQALMTTAHVSMTAEL
jgi:hypothetical protein